MTETYQHYSGTATDTRSYTLTGNMVQHFETVLGDLDGGVVYGKLNGLQVLQHSTGDRSVDVATGWAWVKGQMVINTALYNIAIDENTSVSSRYDRIVLHNEISSGTDDITIIVLKGTPGGARDSGQCNAVPEVGLPAVHVAPPECGLRCSVVFYADNC